MGAFDRRTEKEPSGSPGRQVTIMIVLGVVLMGVVGYQSIKRGPRVAVAETNGAGIPLPFVDETPEQASHALRQDQTSAQFRTVPQEDGTLDQTPRNPFVMSAAWRSRLIQQVEPVQMPEIIPEPIALPQPAPVRVIPTLKAEGYKLGSIIRQGGGFQAIVNGRIVSTGAVVGEARVVEIQEKKVVLQHAQYPEGPRVELLLEPRIR